MESAGRRSGGGRQGQEGRKQARGGGHEREVSGWGQGRKIWVRYQAREVEYLSRIDGFLLWLYAITGRV